MTELPRSVNEQLAGLVGIRRALTSKGQRYLTQAAKLLDEADNYTEKIEAVIDKHLDNEKKAA